MIKKAFLLAFSCVLLLTNGCGPEVSTEWLIPLNEVRDGGPGKDGIPSIDKPNFTDVASVNYLADDDLVFAFRVDDEIHVYPHRILDWHEIANDEVGGFPIAINYCPLTGTGMGWNRIIDGKETTFGVSGLLYNSNIIPYDRKTDSNWSQIRLECVNGELSGTKPTIHQLVETTWARMREMYPTAQVLTTETGFSRDYNRYPYGAYREQESLFFPVSRTDGRLHAKERVFGVIRDERVKVYPFDSFPQARVIADQFGGQNLLIAGSKTDNFIMAFIKPNDSRSFTAIEITPGSAVIMQDDAGNQYDLFGRVVSGPRKGEQLATADGFIGFWFSWIAFYPDVDIFE